MDDQQLEEVVKQNMKDCASGHNDYMVNMTKAMHLDNKTESEMLGSYGIC